MNAVNQTPERVLAPTIFVIIGITGDLAMRKVLPSLISLYAMRLLPPKFRVVGFSRRFFSPQEFRALLREEMHIKPGQFKEEDVKHFLDHVIYEQGMFDDREGYKKLHARLQSIDTVFGQCSNKLFHLAVAPSFYESILNNLHASGLTIPCGGDLGWTRVLVEKPFGNDMDTAKKLDTLLAKLFKEDQIFRIDHYLAKEAVQNILTFRFSNSIFEPLWNRKFIDRVEIKLHERIDVAGRGSFYDSVGALRDVGQNHVLQMLALVAMERPMQFKSSFIRKERAKIFKNLMPITAKTMKEYVVRGQYEGYRSEAGVASGSLTETFFRLVAFVKNGRWKNVPFIIESGKALKDSKVLIHVYFRNEHNPELQNRLTFKIQPDEGIKVLFWVKTPGLGYKVESKPLSFNYSEFTTTPRLPEAYERVLYDAISGDQTLFTSTEEVSYSWKFITPIVNAWDKVPLLFYKKGSIGPASS